MNKNIQALLACNKEILNHKATEYSPLALAYIGDGVYEIFVRTYVINKGNAPVNKMHKASRELVRAETQAKIYHSIEKQLTEEETNVLRRGRNAKSISVPKNADMTQYRHATGLEALIGYLYIKGEIERINELINLGLMGLSNEV
ncbi:Mini-ribonuclease 3 [Sporanaerobium hydrogeniformans]|uniref:Mini-ribonuclease 3 n=1 Tax=Sporanaerobium hydrogeniformans TaxID=3072179 RepID=UPI0026C4151F|nr:ribonuclease III domain-containing protein [Sporanaerobium hydrogeniformans]